MLYKIKLNLTNNILKGEYWSIMLKYWTHFNGIPGHYVKDSPRPVKLSQDKQKSLYCETSGQNTIILTIFDISPYSPLNFKSGQVKFGLDK